MASEYIKLFKIIDNEIPITMDVIGHFEQIKDVKIYKKKFEYDGAIIGFDFIAYSGYAGGRRINIKLKKIQNGGEVQTIEDLLNTHIIGVKDICILDCYDLGSVHEKRIEPKTDKYIQEYLKYILRYDTDRTNYSDPKKSELIDVLYIGDNFDDCIYTYKTDKGYLVNVKTFKNWIEYEYINGQSTYLVNRKEMNLDLLDKDYKKYCDFFDIYCKMLELGKYDPDKMTSISYADKNTIVSASNTLEWAWFDNLDSTDKKKILKNVQDILKDNGKFQIAKCYCNLIPISLLGGTPLSAWIARLLGASVPVSGIVAVFTVIVLYSFYDVSATITRQGKYILDFDVNDTSHGDDLKRCLETFKIVPSEEKVISDPEKKLVLNPLGKKAHDNYNKLRMGARVDYNQELSSIIDPINRNLDILDILNVDLSSNVIETLYIPKINDFLSRYDKLKEEDLDILKENLVILNNKLNEEIQQYKEKEEFLQTVELSTLNKIMKEGE